MIAFLTNWLADAPSNAVPYALAALGLIISERSGVLNLTAEGLDAGRRAGRHRDLLTLGGYPEVRLSSPMVAASVVSLLFAGLVVVLRVNQVIAGLVDRVLLPGPYRPDRHHHQLAEQANRRPWHRSRSGRSRTFRSSAGFSLSRTPSCI